MPPVRIKERARAKKGTLKRLFKELFKRFKVQLIVSAICIVFNIYIDARKQTCDYKQNYI